MTRPTEILVAGLAVAAIVVSLGFAFSGRSPKIELGTYEALGTVAADETARLLGEQGAVLVFVRDTGPDKNPSTESELLAFQHRLKDHPRVGASVERVRMDPMLMMSTGGSLPPEHLFKALADHPHTAAVVLFFAFPMLTDAEAESLKQSGARTVVVSSLRSGYKQLLERHAIDLAIVPRTTAAPGNVPAPRSVRARFDQEFTLLTPADAPALP